MSEKQPVAISAWVGVTVAVVAVLLGVVAAYVLGTNRASGDDGAAAAAETAAHPAGTGMLVSGTGSATGVPDQLRFTVTVQHSAPDVAVAMDATSADARKVVRTLTDQGVAKDDIRTAAVSVQPNHRYSGGQEVITGYSASEKVSVKVRDLTIAGKVISATARVGNAVRIGGLNMSVADPSALLATARSAAIADARTKAEQFAEAAGRELGDVVVVEETEPESEYSLDRGAYDNLATTAGRVPINPGTETTKVHVRVRWSFA